MPYSTGGAADRADSVPALLYRNASLYADQPAYREKELGIWQNWTWSQAAEETENLALGLLDLGLAPGDHVAIIGRNRPFSVSYTHLTLPTIYSV